MDLSCTGLQTLAPISQGERATHRLLRSALEGMMSPGVAGQFSEESQRCWLLEAVTGQQCTYTETSLSVSEM